MHTEYQLTITSFFRDGIKGNTFTAASCSTDGARRPRDGSSGSMVQECSSRMSAARDELAIYIY